MSISPNRCRENLNNDCLQKIMGITFYMGFHLLGHLGSPRERQDSPRELSWAVLQMSWGYQQLKIGSRSVSYTHLTLPTNREV